MDIQSVLVSAVTIIFLLSIFYYYMLLFIKPKKPKIAKKFSSISIIIPAHNEEEYIGKTISYVLAAKFKGTKEIIVVVDGSTDKTYQIAKKFKIKIIKTKHSGKSASINKALAVAKGELIAIVDGDSYIQRDSLMELSKEVGRKGVVAATGVVKVHNRRKLLCIWPHIEQLYNSLIRFMLSKINANIVTPGPLSVYRKKELMEIKGFSKQGFSEDTDVTIRLIRKGYKVGFSEKAVSETNNPYKLKEFLRQRFRLARGLINILKKHLRVNNLVIDIFTLPLLLFAYVQAVVMALFTISQVITGYNTYFLSQGQVLNLHVLKFFFEWFSIVGFVRWFASVITGSTPLTFVTAIGITATLLSYPLYIFAVAKFDKHFDFWNVLPILFMFPFWLVLMIIYTVSIPEYLRSAQYNIWKKNE